MPATGVTVGTLTGRTLARLLSQPSSRSGCSGLVPAQIQYLPSDHLVAVDGPISAHMHRGAHHDEGLVAAGRGQDGREFVPSSAIRAVAPMALALARLVGR